MSVDPEAGIGHGLLGRLDHDAHRLAEDLLAVHDQEPAVLAVQEVLERAIGIQVPAEQVALALDRLDDGRTGPVAHQHGNRTVVPVSDAGQRVAADQQDAPGAHGGEAGGVTRP